MPVGQLHPGSFGTVAMEVDVLGVAENGDNFAIVRDKYRACLRLRLVRRLFCSGRGRRCDVQGGAEGGAADVIENESCA